MTTSTHTLSSWNRLRRAFVLAGAAVLIGAGPGLAQAPKADDSPADGARTSEKHGQPASDTELRKKARELLSKRLEMRKRETEALEHALELFDQGKSLEELRTLLPDLPRFGQRSGEEREQWQRRMEQWGGGRQPGGEDVNRLGGPGGMPQAGGSANNPGSSGMGPGGKPPENTHPLTEEERVTVRELLAATAPETLTRLRELEKTEPVKADQQYSRSLERMRNLIDLRKRDPQMFELKAKDIRHSFEAGALVRAIGDIDKSPTPDTAVRQQKVELLRTALLAQYNVRTQIMQREIERSADRAAEMAKEVEKRPAQAADIVDKNVRDMIDREHRRRERQGGDNGRGGEHHGTGADGKPGEPPPRQ
jgi:hypothetical protein